MTTLAPDTVYGEEAINSDGHAQRLFGATIAVRSNILPGPGRPMSEESGISLFLSLSLVARLTNTVRLL